MGTWNNRSIRGKEKEFEKNSKEMEQSTMSKVELAFKIIRT